MKDADQFRERDLVILGGGDSALDWAIDFADKARVTLVHRRAEFRGAPASAARLKELAAAGKIRHHTGIVTALRHSGEALSGVEMSREPDGSVRASVTTSAVE